jgi:hypothetical protein
MMKQIHRSIAATLLLGTAVAMSATPAKATIRVLPFDSEYVENLVPGAMPGDSDIFKLIVPAGPPAYLDISAFSGPGDTLSVDSSMNGTDFGTIDITSAGGIIDYTSGVWTVMITLTGPADPLIGTELLASQPDGPLPDPATTPLPAALPLFATGLGTFGFFGWRRKRKSAAGLTAA